MTSFKLGLQLSTALGILLSASLANASVISIGLQEAGVNGGAITTIGSSSSGFLQASGAYGSFVVNGITAQDSTTLAAPDLLNSQSINTSANTAGTLFVYVTSTGLTSPIGTRNMFSTFTVNALSSTLTVTESTYYSNSSTPYAMTNPLGSATFSALGTQASTNVATLGATYTLTELYRITATGSGNSNLTIDLQSAAIPEPLSLTLLASGLFTMGLLRRRASKV